MTRLVAALPIAIYVLQLRLVLHRSAGSDWRRAVLDAALLWGVTVTAITEALGACRSLGFFWIAAAWVFVGAGFALAELRSASVANERAAITGRPPIMVMCVAATSAIVLGTGLAAAFGSPNQWDSMVYHLPRVDHWLQNASVELYPTHVPRQLYNPPWAEYAILQLAALGGDARLGNFVQWLCMLGSLVGISSIARHLGASPPTQWVSVLAAASIPMGVLQAPTTQNDYATTFWLVCLAEAALDPSGSTWRIVRVSAALGLAVLTKGTALVFGPVLFACLWGTARERSFTSARAVALAALVVIALNGGHWLRNVRWYGSPLGPADLGSAIGTGDSLVNDRFAPSIIVSNVVRNTAVHVGTPFDAWNGVVERVVVRVHGVLGIDPFDPRSTRAYPETRYMVKGSLGDPDRTGNPWHLALILASAIAVASTGESRHARARRGFALALLVAGLAFCVVLKWQPWHSRLHLPLFVLGSALVGCALERFDRTRAAIVAISLLVALPPLLRNRLAPLVGARNVFNTSTIEQTFQAFGGPPIAMERAYLGALGEIRELRCPRVGLVLAWDDWEHPLWAFFPGDVGARHLEHVLVAGVDSGTFRPCAIVSTRSTGDETLELDGRRFRSVWSEELGASRRLSVLVPRE